MNKWFTILLLLLQVQFSAAQITDLKVVLFFSPSCPICIQYTPKILLIDSVCKVNGVDFSIVLPRAFSLNEAKEFNDKFSTSFVFTIDKRSKLVKQYGAQITPQIFIAEKRIRRIIYDGAIDNWYTSVGSRKIAPNKEYFLDALNAVLSGKEVEVVKTTPVGCLIN